jgi:adenylate kinase family enzyme
VARGSPIPNVSAPGQLGPTVLDTATPVRVSVVGTSCCGKTTFARELAAVLGTAHVELDPLYWLPNWVERSPEDFRAHVSKAVANESWVIDGNYSKSRDIVWGRATHVIWLNYSFPVIWWRAISRTVRRAISGEELFSGNRESWRRVLLSHDSMIIWVLATFRHNRVKYRALRQSSEWQHIDFQEFNNSAQTAEFLARLGASEAEEEERE